MMDVKYLGFNRVFKLFSIIVHYLYITQFDNTFKSGQLQFLDIGGHMSPRSMYIYHVNTHGGMLTGFDISPNGQASVFSDSSGILLTYKF